MAYGTPADPVGGTVITVAYAVANILDPIRWLRLLTGNADPPGSAYVVVSDSTTGTTWRKVPADALAAGAVVAHLGYTPANAAGQAFGGAVSATSLSSSGAIAATGGVSGASLSAGAGGVATTGNVSGVNGSFSGSVSATGGYGAVGGTTGNFSGALSAASLSSAGAIAATTGVSGASVSATGAVAGGTVSAVSSLTRGGVEASLVTHTHAGSVPSGAVVWFETAAELTAAGAGWAAYTAAAGRLLIGAGTTGSQSFTEATSYGTAWEHTHPNGTLDVAGTTAGVTSTATANLQAGATPVTISHTHNEGTLTVIGDTGGTAWLPFLRAGVYGRKS